MKKTVLVTMLLFAVSLLYPYVTSTNAQDGQFKLLHIPGGKANCWEYSDLDVACGKRPSACKSVLAPPPCSKAGCPKNPCAERCKYKCLRHKCGVKVTKKAIKKRRCQKFCPRPKWKKRKKIKRKKRYYKKKRKRRYHKKRRYRPKKKVDPCNCNCGCYDK